MNEQFKDITPNIIPGIYPWYMISNFGKVYNKYEGKLEKIYIANKNSNINNPYYTMSFCTINGYVSVMIHRLILAVFYPELGPLYQKLDVHHKNGNTLYNFISYNDYNHGNIEWMTHSENMLEAYKDGSAKIGEDNVHSKISNKTALKIIQLLSSTSYTSKEICAIVGGGATEHIVDDIRKKQCWRHLSKGYTFNQRINRQFTEQDVHNFCKNFEQLSSSNISINEKCRRALINNGFEPLNNYVETLRKIYTKKYYINIVSQYNW